MAISWRPEFSHQDLEILSETTVYSGYGAIKQYTARFRLFQGGWSQPITRDILCRAASEVSAVLLYDPEQDKVVMIEQIRLGALHDPQSSWLLEIVAGIVESNETPESTAYKESKEEANCDVWALKPICTYYVSPGISQEKTYVFCGFIRINEAFGTDGTEDFDTHKADSTQKPNSHPFIHGLSEEGEDIKCHIFSTDEVLTLLHQGIITSASAVIALQWLALNRASLNSSL